MSRVNRGGLLALALTLVLGACEPVGQGPPEEAQLGQPDAMAISAVVDLMNSTLETPQFESIRSLHQMPGIPSADELAVVEAGDLLALAMSSASIDGPGADAFAEVQQVMSLGRAFASEADVAAESERSSFAVGTYDWDVTAESYTLVPSSANLQLAASDACGDVSTFVLYVTDPFTGRPSWPLTKIGYLNVVKLCDGNERLTVVGLDGTTLVDVVLAISSIRHKNGDWDRLYEVDGWIGAGPLVLTLDVDFIKRESVQCRVYRDCVGTSPYLVDVAMSMSGIDIALSYDFVITEAGFDVQRTSSFDMPTQLLALITTEYYELIGPDTYWVTFYSNIMVDGSLYGFIDATGDGFLYLLPNGEPMAPEDINALQALFEQPLALMSAVQDLVSLVISLLGPSLGGIIPPTLLP